MVCQTDINAVSLNGIFPLILDEMSRHGDTKKAKLYAPPGLIGNYSGELRTFDTQEESSLYARNADVLEAAVHLTRDYLKTKGLEYVASERDWTVKHVEDLPAYSSVSSQSASQVFGEPPVVAGSSFDVTPQPNTSSMHIHMRRLALGLPPLSSNAPSNSASTLAPITDVQASANEDAEDSEDPEIVATVVQFQMPPSSQRVITIRQDMAIDAEEPREHSEYNSEESEGHDEVD